MQRTIGRQFKFNPGPSSQTTNQWPLVMQTGEEQLRSSGVSLDGGDSILRPPRELTWNEAVDEVMEDRAELWAELSEL